LPLTTSFPPGGVVSEHNMNMNAHRLTHTIFRIVAVSLGLTAFCFAQTVEHITLPASGLSNAIRHNVEEKGYRVKLDSGGTFDLWFAQTTHIIEKNVPGALYPDLEPGDWIAIMTLHQDTPDFRGQTVRAGTYTLRYELLPQDGNHLGVAPNPDFLLASPVAEDPTPVQPLVLKKVVEMSSKSTGGSHPAVFALDTAGEPGTVTTVDSGKVLSVAIPGAPKTERIGICLTCSAPQ
jgi:hypothetical protein